METIKIFLASSGELKQDREAFRNFISVENDRLYKKGVYLKLDDWEYNLDPVAPEGTQNEYNQVVKESDIMVCLFYKKAGPYTIEEFNTALKQFRETGKPLIYIWLKTETDNNIPVPGEAQSLQEFRKRVDQIKHFYKCYRNNNDLHKQFRLQLDLMAEKGIIKFRKEKQHEVEEAIKDYGRKRRHRLLLITAICVIIATLSVLVTFKLIRRNEKFKPFNLKVSIENKTPNAGLPDPVGALLLTYGIKTEPKDSIKTEASFESIPGNYRNDTLRLRYTAEGFLPVDTGIVYTGKVIVLPVYRNQDLAELKGFISNDAGQPLGGVRVFTDCCSTTTDASGRFALHFPFRYQRVQQRVQMYKQGYQPKDFTSPVKPGEMPRLVLYR